MKDYVRLNAYELGQIMGAIDKTRLGVVLQLKLREAVDHVYLDSGYTDSEVFGDLRRKEHRENRATYYAKRRVATPPSPEAEEEAK